MILHGSWLEGQDLCQVCFLFLLSFVLPSHLAFMNSKLVEVVQMLHLVKLIKTKLNFNLGEELIIIIIIRFFQ
jgi:hypothetical protein